MSLVPEITNVDFDDLEKGFLKAYPQNYFSPRNSNEFRRTLFHVNREKTVCKLNEDPSNEFLLEAQYNQRTQTWEIYQYNTKTQRNKTISPIAYLKSYTKDKWALWSTSCEQCDSNYHFGCVSSHSTKDVREQLMLIENGIENLQDSIMYTMNIIIPSVDKFGKRKTWCPRQYPQSNNFNNENYIIKDFDRKARKGASDDDCVNLSTIKPQWNEIQQAYCIDFGGRIQKNSKRNIQIKKTDGGVSEVLCQFGKKDKNLYILDYKSPLSLVQALAIGLTSLHWE